MERLRGTTLRDELERCGALSPSRAAGIFEQMLAGLQVAHAEGIVHRDLKPENVMLARQADGTESVRLLDFGLAKLREHELAETQINLSASGVIMGTFGYMSPEQLLGKAVDERADLFAVGVMLVECLTGARPFTGNSYPEMVESVLNQQVRLSGEGEDTTRLNGILERCLARDSFARVKSAVALKDELIPALRAQSTLVTKTQATRDARTDIA